MISKKVFVNTMENVTRYNEFEFSINNTIRDYCVDGYIYNPLLENTIVDILKEIFNDKEDWIEYAIYELNFLKDYKEDSCYYEENETKIPIDIGTWEKLYDFLLENVKNY